MREVVPDRAWLQPWLDAEQPGPDAIAGHVVATGHGRCWVDRPAQPRAFLLETGGNYLMGGDADAIDPAALTPLIRGFVAAPPTFAPLLDAAFDSVVRWDRVIYQAPPTPPAGHPDGVRPLLPADAGALAAMHPDAAWISKTWGGPAGLAASGRAWGAFAGGRLVAVACTFFLGERHEDLGVVTDLDHQARGLATACASSAWAHVASTGHAVSWSTSVDNRASRRVAEKLGFRFVRTDVLHVIGIDVP
jgi:RimJ/RimL family protein N-acetyltransferase